MVAFSKRLGFNTSCVGIKLLTLGDDANASERLIVCIIYVSLWDLGLSDMFAFDLLLLQPL